MVKVVLELYPSGCLKSLTATGHAGAGTKDHDAVCAAVSVLVRTAWRALRREPYLQVEGRAASEGDLSVTVALRGFESEERFRGLTDFLLTGLFDLAAEHPRHVSVDFRKS
ncbi:MAG: ribosomal-processing cysteine protease Prp [Spirochaetales bacterium]|nr:ribosomal-processing cysteine protease Prp [Spirochaetales bacterium]